MHLATHSSTGIVAILWCTCTCTSFFFCMAFDLGTLKIIAVCLSVMDVGVAITNLRMCAKSSRAFQLSQKWP